VSAGFLILIIGLFVLLWILFIRPQRRRQVAQQQMLEELEPGVEILTAGGLYGTVRAIDGDELTVEIAPGTDVRLARRAVAAVIPEESPAEGDGAEPDESAEPEELAAGTRPPGEKRS
jgi:preprotein translocase subunit YajC